METTTLESNKKIASQFFEYYSKGDIKQIENLWGSDYQLHFPGSPKAFGKEETKQILKEYTTGFPDVKFSIEDQIAEGDLVVTRISVNATHTGVFQGIPATNKKITVTGIGTHRIVNDKIVEEWAEFDAIGMLKQIGVVPEMATAQH